MLLILKNFCQIDWTSVADEAITLFTRRFGEPTAPAIRRPIAGFRQYKDRIGRPFERGVPIMAKKAHPSLDFNTAKYSKFADRLTLRKEQRQNPDDTAGPRITPTCTTTLAAVLTNASPPLEIKVTKTSAVIAALRSEDGASLETIMVMTGWQAHSVRGFLSGTVRKKLGFEVTRCANADGITCYRIIKAMISETTPTAADTAGATDGLATATVLAAEPRRSERPRVRCLALSPIQVSASVA